MTVHASQISASINFTHPLKPGTLTSVFPKALFPGQTLTLKLNGDARNVTVSIAGVSISVFHLQSDGTNTRVQFSLPVFSSVSSNSSSLAGIITTESVTSSFNVLYRVWKDEMQVTAIYPSAASTCGSDVTLYLSNVDSSDALVEAEQVAILWSEDVAPAKINKIEFQQDRAVITATTPIVPSHSIKVRMSFPLPFYLLSDTMFF